MSLVPHVKEPDGSRDVDILFPLVTLAFSVVVFLILIGIATFVERVSEEPRLDLHRTTDSASGA
jgi:hypothetical protein